jgi:tRNA pseudouridine55 synthase
VTVVAVGKATRLLRFLNDEKAYRAEVLLGFATDSADLEGKVLATADVQDLNRDDVERVLPAFTGPIRQRPPFTYAVHLDGKRLYEYARRGEHLPESAIPEREVVISGLKLLSFTPGSRATLRLDITCSAGTYIRSLAVDIGRSLGVPACLSFLLRTRAGVATSQEAQTLEELTLGARWLSLDHHLGHLPSRVLTPEEVTDVRHGRTVVGQGSGFVRLLDEQGALVAMGEARAAILQPVLVF